MSEGRSGLLVVDKPGGMTSHDVVARVRRILGIRKVGHAGTLDPMATGILLLGVGRATRLLGHLAIAEKTYDATVRLGSSTSTDDAEGETLRRVTTDGVSEDDVRRALARMVGEVEQVPSTVSAVKVAGRRSYERARAGEQVELAARRVTIHEIVVHDVRGGRDEHGGWLDVDLTVRCSSGTYVRAVARDLGDALGVGGHLTALRRTAVGAPGRGFRVDEAAGLERLAEQQEVELLPMGVVARRFLRCVTVDDTAAEAVGHGRRLHLDLPGTDASAEPEPVAVLDEGGRLLALYRRAEPRADGDHAPLAVLC